MTLQNALKTMYTIKIKIGGNFFGWFKMIDKPH